MIDFYEGWNLRNRLIADGYLRLEDEVGNGRDMAMKIYELAREHYDWKPAEPTSHPKPSQEYAEFLESMTPTTRLNHIYDIAIDWDGNRGIRSLGNLIDEIISCTIPPCKSESEALEEVKLVKNFESVFDFLDTHVTEDKLPFTWNFDGIDVNEVRKWCKNNNYEYRINIHNYATNGKIIGTSITIMKGMKDDFI